MPHPELALERARLRFAEDCLAAMRRRTADRVSNEDVLAANEADAEAVKWQLRAAPRLARRRRPRCSASAASTRRSATAGTSAAATSRTTKATPVVVDWRAAVATPFYRATLADPFGLSAAPALRVHRARALRRLRGGLRRPRLARRFRWRARPAARRARASPHRADARHRRDDPGRAGRDHPRAARVVSRRAGRPGTGKTAVGLHRAAFLLYEHRALLGREGVLVVGPNPVFLRYISQVLPSLGETSATQTTVDGLLALRFRVVGRRSAAVAAVKGDARMATVIARAAARRDQGARRRADAPVPSPDDRVPGRRGAGARRRRARPRRRRSARGASASGTSLLRRAYDRYTGGVAIELDESRLRRRAARRPGVAQGDRRSVEERERGRARAVAADAAGARCARAADGVLDGRRAGAAPAAARGRPTRGRRTTCRCSTRPRRS